MSSFLEEAERSRNECYLPRDTKRQIIHIGDTVRVLGSLQGVLPVEWHGQMATVIEVTKYGFITLLPTQGELRTARKLSQNLCAIFLLLVRKEEGE